MNKSAVKKCAEIYINAYSEAPWNEKYQVDDVEKYITNFMDSDTIELTATDGKTGYCRLSIEKGTTPMPLSIHKIGLVRLKQKAPDYSQQIGWCSSIHSRV